jgi:hypothetical protein
MDKKITKLSVFDMDGTLIINPDKDECERVWVEKFNKPWPYVGVYSKPESLDFTIFEIPIIPHIVEEYKKAHNDENVYTVLLTGRLIKLKKEVKNLLDNKGLYFDEYLLNNKGETLLFKLFELERLLNDFPDIEEITFFDDRDEHIPYFIELGEKLEIDMLKKGKPFKFNMIHVK